MSKKKSVGINWRYAFGEIILIFLGITAAISFNNWNESKKSAKIEIQSLREIREALQQDLYDIEENVIGFQGRVALYKLLTNHIEENLPMSDSLERLMPEIKGLTTFFSNNAAYETLRSRGIETITNDSIRLKISLYYDLEHKRIISNEIEHHQHFKNYIKPLLLEKFDLSNFQIKMVDYDQLMNDVEFARIIYWAQRTDSYMLSLYIRIEEKARQLLLDLKQEIDRLD